MEQTRDSNASRAGPELSVALDAAIPPALPFGTSTAIFCCGTCFHRYRDVTAVMIVVGGERYPVTASHMPRLDLFTSLHPSLSPVEERSAESDPDSSRDPELRSFRSGFWATVPVRAPERAERIEIELEARLAGGGSALATLATMDAVEPPTPPSHGTGELDAGQEIAICMATFDPDPELFRIQVESLRSQTHSGWICVISDDCSSPERFEAILEAVKGDRRFIVSRSESRLGFYRNFERALGMAPPEAELIALCDQDDRWYPDKLERLREALGDAQIAYSDQRLVDREGRVLRQSLWERRRNNHTNYASLLIANTIVGASALFRRRVIDVALPFPEGPGWQFHDHWLAVVGMGLGRVAYVDRPLYDYVQHADAVVGKVAVERRPKASLSPWRRLREYRGFFTRWRATYFRSYLQLELQASVVRARCSEELSGRKRRAAHLLVAAGRSPLALAWLAARQARRLVGRNETLATEAHLIRGIVWRHLTRLVSTGRRRPGRIANEAAIPPFDVDSFGQKRLKRWLASG